MKKVATFAQKNGRFTVRGGVLARYFDTFAQANEQLTKKVTLQNARELCAASSQFAEEYVKAYRLNLPPVKDRIVKRESVLQLFEAASESLSSQDPQTLNLGEKESQMFVSFQDNLKDRFRLIKILIEEGDEEFDKSVKKALAGYEGAPVMPL